LTSEPARNENMTSEQEKNLFLQAQAYQQQVQNILMQKESANMQVAEIRNALDELGKAGKEDVYKIAGTVIVKATNASVTKELTEKKESLEAIMKTLDASEKKIKAKMVELRGQFGKPEKGE
jgi:prefoldin beta subunit